MGELTIEASASEQLAEKFEGRAAKLAKSSAEYLSEVAAYFIGKDIYHAWLHDLLTSVPAIHKSVSWVVDNPPPAETKEARRSRGSTGRPLRSQQKEMEAGIFAVVFNLLHSMGEIERGRIGGEQLCRRLAEILLGADSGPANASKKPKRTAAPVVQPAVEQSASINLVWKQSLARQREAFDGLAHPDPVLPVQAVWYPIPHEAKPSPKSQVFEAKSKKLAVIGSCEFVTQNSGLPFVNGTDPEGSILLQYLCAKEDSPSKEKLRAWRAIAEKAASAVAGVPVAMLRDFGLSHIPKDADDWTYLIFLLAWQKRRGWTLEANQTAESPSGTMTSRKLGGQYSLWKMLWDGDTEAIRRAPWFSFLPDLTVASIEAIDIVMGYASQYEQPQSPPAMIPAEQTVVDGDGTGDAETEVPVGLVSLTPAPKRAWASWKLAEANHAEVLQDRTAYDWLAEQPDETFIGDLVGYELPAFATWQRYVREARKAVGESKNQPRAWRAAGGSVVGESEI